MNIMDIVIVVIFIFGIYIGYQSGFIKQLNDLFILFVASFLSGRISDLLFNVLYRYLPFLNFKGKSEGLKSINIIFWKLILFVLVIMIIISLIRKIWIKLKIEEKINDTIVEVGLISRILGVVLSVPLMIVLTFDIILVLSSPNFNITSINKSKLASTIMEKTPILSKENGNLYNNQKYIIKRINEEDNTLEEYENVNEDIIQNMIDTNFISEDIIEKLRDKNKLLGERKEKEETSDETEEDEENYEDEGFEEDEELDDTDFEDNEDFESEDFEDEEFIEDEEFEDDFEDEEFDEEFDDEELSEEYCNEFPEDC